MIKKLMVVAVALCLLLVSCATIGSKPQKEEKLYRTYLVNESSHFAEYVIVNLKHKVTTHSGILPPKWSVKNPYRSWDGFDRRQERSTSGLPWVLKIDLPESLLGKYGIAIRFLLAREGAHEDGPWMHYMVNLTKEDYKDPKLIPYWEITDDMIKKTSWIIERTGCTGECKGNCYKSKSITVPLEKAELFMHFMNLKEIKIPSDEYDSYMELVYDLLYDDYEGHEDAANALRKHIGEMKFY